MEKHEFCAVHNENFWYAWSTKDHTRKFRGRSLREAMGQLMVSLFIPDTATLCAVGPSGKFVIPTPQPTIWGSDEVRNARLPYKLA